MRSDSLYEVESLQSAETAHPIQMLRDDHQKVQHLFEEFDRTEDMAAKKRLVETALRELTIHATLEEEIFYPTIRKEMDDEDMDILDEALEEHHVAKMLIGELEGMRHTEKRWEAKFSVLAEMVRHHIREEESEMLPKVEDLDLNMERLAQRMMERKAELQDNPSPSRSTGRGSSARGPSPRPSARRSQSTKTGARRMTSSQVKSRKKAA